MKPTQTVVLLGIVVVMIFAVTFVKMYDQAKPKTDAAKDRGTKESLRRLTFASTSYPDRDPNYAGENSPVGSEYGVKAHCDFWFENANEEVRVGLVEKGCGCSDVQLFVAPDGWSKGLADVALQRVGGRFGIVSRMVRLGAVSSLETLGPLRALIEKTEGQPVPPRAVGFVRLEWVGRADGSRSPNLTAKLWMQSPTSPLTANLQVGARLVDPIQVSPATLDVGLLNPGDATRKVLRCWSLTRSHFDLDVRSTGAPFVTCVKEPLQHADYQVLRKSGLPIASGYRIVVSVRERTEDGKRRSDEGPFAHTVTLTPSLPLEAMQVALTGNVRGDITVNGAENGIHLESFAVRTGTHRTVTLATDRAGLNLKLDAHPPFLKVRLEKLTTAGEVGSRWRLHLEIEPNKVSGSFPRSDSKVYQDSAIYLKIEGAEGRRMRIPVSGEAVQ